MRIDSLTQIYAAIPNVIEIGDELHSPCPFCEPTQRSRISRRNGLTFVGEDRFFWQTNYSQFYCRHCGRHSLEETVEKLFGGAASVSLEFHDTLPKVANEHRELVLYDETYVQELHSKVSYDYWQNFNWTRETIDKFQLGYGKLYPHSSGANRHIIPFVPKTADKSASGFALEGRLEKPFRNEPRNMRTAGVTKEYFSEIVEGDSSFAYICEGLKDAISAYQIGFRHIYCFFGNGTDLESFASYVAAKNYFQVLLFSHNDEMGEKYQKKIQALVPNLYCLEWPHDAKRGYDLTNLLEEFGNNASLYCTQNLIELREEPVKGYIPDVRYWLPDYEPISIDSAVSTETVRSELPEVLDEYITNYDKKRRMAGRGIVKVLGAYPGSGKSYALVQMAEKLARKALLEFQIECRALDKAIAALTQETPFILDSEALEENRRRIETFRERRANLSCATVLYAGPFITGWQDILDQGADENLWYNYEARNEDNCENIYTVSKLASKGYVPMAYCQSVCPLKSHCEKHGYLSQDAERKAHPITYVRHQQLVTAMVNEYKYIIIDESCLPVFDAPTVVDVSQLVPTYEYWDSHADMVQVKLILELVEGVRQALLEAGENHVYSGREVMRMIDHHMLGNLVETLQRIDPKIVMDFQPKTVMQGIDTSQVPIRCLPVLYQTLLSELELYQSSASRYNSGLHIVNQELEIYSLEKLHIPSNRPIIISDGTPLPLLYGMLFDREVETYSPVMYSPEAQTTVYCGSDFTITSIRKQLGVALQDFHRWLDDNDKTVSDLFDEEFDLNAIPFDESIYESSVMRRALALIKMTAERHSSLLFITYKPIRAILEKRVKELYPDLAKKIHFAHYWSLRGTNRFKDMEAVLLLGCPRIPYDALYRRIQAWGKIAQMQWISPAIKLSVAAYSGDSRYDGYTYPNFTDDFASSFVDMVEAGEIQQNTERIRQHTSKRPKYAYLAMSRPAARWVTTVSRVGEAVNNYDNDNFRNAYQEMLTSYLTTQGFPSYNSISSKYHLSNSKVSAIKRSIINGGATAH